MPELPEVETVRRGLAPSMEGQTIIRADVNRPDLRWPFPKNMAGRLTGRHVQRLRRRAKYILADLDGGESLLIHLGMSGRMEVSGEPAGKFAHNTVPAGKHDHVLLHMSGGTLITYNDPRRFGAMDLLATDDEASHRFLAALGPEPLGNSLDQSYLEKALAKRKVAIKTALLDQRIIAGLGNIYVCEVLFRAGIHPETAAKLLSPEQITLMLTSIREVLREAIEAGGSTLQDHRQVDGQLGYFQHNFKVYARQEKACAKEGCDGQIDRIQQAGRSSFYCPSCQR